MDLKELIETQKEVSTDVPGMLTNPTLIAHALTGEVHELIDEIGQWKPWKKPKPELNKDRVLDEAADILAFLGNLLAYTLEQVDATPEELSHAYVKKTQINKDRIAGKVEGYGL
jgi:dimeric dUTPase (all-alpha-NTP-PPase superfamily)